MFDSPTLALYEWAEIAVAVESETDLGVSHSVWEADKNSDN